MCCIIQPKDVSRITMSPLYEQDTKEQQNMKLKIAYTRFDTV